MTVSTTSIRTSATGSNVAGQTVTFSFPVYDSSEVVVMLRVTATGIETVLAETTNYTVVLDSEIGGTVTVIAAVPVTSQIHIIRSTDGTQLLDLAQGGAWNAEQAEAAFDKLTKIADEQSDSLDRVLRTPVTDPVITALPNKFDRAGMYLAFDSSGNPVTLTEIDPGLIAFTAIGTTIATAANAAAVVTALSLTIGTNTQAYSLQLTNIAALGVPADGAFLVGNGTTWVKETTSTARTSLGFSTYMSSLASIASEVLLRAALEVNTIPQIVTYDGSVVVYRDDVVTTI